VWHQLITEAAFRPQRPYLDNSNPVRTSSHTARRGFAIVKAMNKKILWIVGLLALVLVIIAGIFYYQAHSSLSTQTTAMQSSPISDTSPTTSNKVSSYTTQTEGTTTIITITDPAFENSGWIPASNTTTTLTVGGTVYHFNKLSSPCTEDYGIVCDNSLVATTNGTTTVLIPSIVRVVSSDSNTIPSFIYFIGTTKSQLFFQANVYGDESSNPIGVYSVNLATKEVSKLSYIPGACGTGAWAGSPYIIDYYNGTTTSMEDINQNQIMVQTIKVFSLIDNAVVYTQTLTPPQEIEDGGMGCQAFYGGLNTSSTFYNIVNAIDYTPVSTVEINYL
jgi:hypothetical protein